MIVYSDKNKTPFVIDDDDWEIVSRYTWCINCGYPRTSVKRTYKNPARFFLHQLLLGRAPDGFEWDHKNRNRLDNRRDNFRLVPRQINRRNMGIQQNNTSGVKGVSKDKRSGLWLAYISRENGSRVRLGLFHELDEAARVRRDAEELYWGEDR